MILMNGVSIILASDGLAATARLRDQGMVRVAYVPTAAAVLPEPAIVTTADLEQLQALDFEVRELDIAERPGEISAVLDWAQGVVVGGGSVFHLLEQMRVSGFDRAVRRAVRDGMPYVGVSGGAIAACGDLAPWRMVTREQLTAERRRLQGLALTDVIILPHAGDRRARYAPVLARWVGRRRVIAIDDDQAVVVEGSTVTVVPSKRPRTDIGA